MKILVCFKIIPDLDQMSPKDYIPDEKMDIDTSFVRTMWNCFDESGLEFGLRLSDEAESLNLYLEKTALTVAEEQAELYLKTLKALRYTQTVRLAGKGKDIRFCPCGVGEKIAGYVKEFPQDFVIMGRQASPGNNGLTSQYTAEALGVPLIANIVDLHLLSDHEVLAVTEEEGSLYEQTITSPAVLSIGNAVISKLRVPTLRDRMKYGKEPVRVVDGTEYQRRKQSGLRFLDYISRERNGEILEAEGAGAAEELIRRYEQRKEGKE